MIVAGGTTDVRRMIMPTPPAAEELDGIAWYDEVSVVVIVDFLLGTEEGFMVVVVVVRVMVVVVLIMVAVIMVVVVIML